MPSSTTTCSFIILESYVKRVGTYGLTISHDSEFPINSSTLSIIDDIKLELEDKGHFVFEDHGIITVVSLPVILEFYPTNVIADTPATDPSMVLTLYGANFTSYTI